MDFEYDINAVIKNDYFVYFVTVVTLIYVFFHWNIEPITKFVDSMFGKTILLFLIVWLLSEEHYTVAICIIIIILSTLYWIRERGDYDFIKYTINRESEKQGGKCSREGVRFPESEREVPGPENSVEFHNL